MEAIDNGAIDYIAKPGTFNVGLENTGDDLVRKIKSLSRLSKRRLQDRMSTAKERIVRTRETDHAPVPVNTRRSSEVDKVLLIGASTGGPGLIEDICNAIPSDYNMPVFVVQHMPEKFTASFANRLARASNLPVIESVANQEIAPGNIYVAKGGFHLQFAKKVSGKIVMRHEEDKNNKFFQPSVDEMMQSAVSVFNGEKIIAVLLTGIGDDGAKGMLAIKKAGGFTMAESEETATVYGMPKVAVDIGGVSEELPFPKILQRIKTLK